MKPGWIEDQNGCLHWNATPASGDSVIWSGGCRDGRAHGTGTAEWRRDGALRGTYVGGMRAGKLDGEGVFTGPDGETYDGQWKDGLRHGNGVWTSARGTRYAGLYAAGKAHGEGTNTWADGSSFTGEFLEGRRWNGIHYDAAQDRTLEIQLGRWKLTGRPAD